MSKAKQFWDELADGRAARVTLPSEARRPPRRTRVVRTAPWSHYAGFDPAQTGRPRCRAEGCGKYLRRDQAYACSATCEKQVRAQLASLQRAVLGKEAA